MNGMMMQKWNFRTHNYEPYSVPESWETPLVVGPDDLDREINCASCGAVKRAGEMYTSTQIHTPMGMGYPVCGVCYEREMCGESS